MKSISASRNWCISEEVSIRMEKFTDMYNDLDGKARRIEKKQTLLERVLLLWIMFSCLLFLQIRHRHSR